jgi:hypothetical protein
MSEQGGLPALPETHAGKAFTLNVAGIPIPLRRTFGAIDRLISIPIEALADAVESKFKGNLNSHVEAVQTRRSKKRKKTKIDDPSVKTTKAIADWAVGAGAVEQADKELSALWRTILDKIMENEDEGEDLLRVVQSLSNADLRYFLNRFAGMRTILARFGQIAPEGTIERLRSAGLIYRPVSLSLLFGASIIMFIAFSFVRSFYQIILSPFVISVVQGHGFISTLLAIGAAAVALLFLLRHSPTQAGDRLSDLYREYLNSD